jgi:hypothetical protein
MEFNFAAEKDPLVDCGPSGDRGTRRVTVNLTARSSAALELSAALSGDTRTDTINRALQVYAFLVQVAEEGGSAHIRYSDQAELERIGFLG